MEATSVPAAPFWKTLVREPLLHFVVLGGLVFALDSLLVSERRDPYVIVVAPELDEELRAKFHTAERRDPTPAELKQLRERWVDNEVLYREGLALGLEQGDATLRERLIAKVLNVIEADVHVPQAEDAELRAWFDQHRARYDIPARVDFSEALFAGGTDGAAAQQLATALNRGLSDPVQANLRLFAGRPLNTIVEGFGAPFANALEKGPLGVWQVLLSTTGPRVVRLEYRTQVTSARFDAVRREVARDLRETRAQGMRAAKVREFSEKYAVRFAGGES